MLLNIREKWNFRVKDWVTSISLMKKEHIFFGTRDGFLYLIDWYNNELFSMQLESWVGALKTLSYSEGNFTNEYLFVATKNGWFYIYKVDKKNHSNPLTEVYKIKANNTIREIDIYFIKTKYYDSAYVAFGSEDRKIYLLNLKDILNDSLNKPEVKSFETNGWIRTISFYKSTYHGVLIIAGCGDKHLYFYNLNGDIIEKINVNSKVHSIITKNKIIYAVSDTQIIHKIQEQKEGTFLLKNISLNYRATKLYFEDFENTEKNNYFIVSEKENIFLYDTNDKCKSKFNFNKVYSFSIMSQDTILIGGEHSLQCYKYSIDEGTCHEQKEDKSLIHDSKIFEYSTAPKQNYQNIGIGRFMHIIKEKNMVSPKLAIIGTDDGKVILLHLTNKIKILANEEMINSRIWSVYAYWQSDTVLKAFIATSNKNILVYSLHFVYLENREEVKIFWEKEDEIKTPDWVREIRPTEGIGEESYVAVTEKGDIDFYNKSKHNKKLKISNNGKIISSKSNEQKYQIFRTIAYHHINNQSYELFTGSDNNQVFYYNTKEDHTWSKYTFDRVRETLIYGDILYAVSEDRFLYTYLKDGSIQYRYKFPHRALCIDIYEDEGNIYIVVGCGDGYIYILNNNVIVYSYSYADRIRDLKIIDNQKILLVSENFYSYYEELPNIFYANNKLNNLLNKMYLSLIANDNNIEATTNLSIFNIFFLLEYTEVWVSSDEDNSLLIDLIEIAFKHIDIKCEENSNITMIKYYYTYAKALFQLIDNEYNNYQAEFISKVSRYLSNQNNYYIHHSIISILSTKVKNKQIDIADFEAVLRILFKSISFSNNWIIEESILLLEAIGYYDLSAHSSKELLDSIKIPYSKLQILMNYILEKKDTQKIYVFNNKLVNESDVFMLLNILKIDNIDEAISKLKKCSKIVYKNLDFLIDFDNIKSHTKQEAILKYKNDFFSKGSYLLEILDQIPIENCSPTKEQALKELLLYLDLVNLKLNLDENKLSIREYLAVEFYIFFVKMIYK